jgi:hypothetical protein
VIGSLSVVAPDGREWIVSRSVQWPRYRRFGDRDLLDIPYLDLGPGDDFLGGIVAAIAVVLIVALLIVVFLPLILFVVEVLFVVAGAMLAFRPWLVKTVCPGSQIDRRWLVRGPLRARRAVREVADELAQGVRAEPEHGVPA